MPSHVATLRFVASASATLLVLGAGTSCKEGSRATVPDASFCEATFAERSNVTPAVAQSLDASAPSREASALGPEDPVAPDENLVPSPLSGAVLNIEEATVLESTPTSYSFDGDVSEWVPLPAGTVPAERGHAKLWVALTEAGLFMAGEVDAALGSVHLDRVRLEFALKPPRLPPIAIINHLMAHVVDEHWCKTEGSTFPTVDDAGLPPPEQVSDCLAWLARCEKLRTALAGRFQRTIDVDLAAAKVSGVIGARVFVRGEDAGKARTFELEVPLTSLPETSEMPLRTVRVIERLFSSEGPKSGQQAERADVPAWAVSRRQTPLSLHAAPAIVEHIARESAATDKPKDVFVREAASYIPSPTTTKVSFFFNVGEAGQWTPDPSTESPQIVELDVTHGRLLFTLRGCPTNASVPRAPSDAPCARGGDISITAHPTFFDDTYGKRHPMVSMVSRHGNEVLDVSASTTFDPYELALRGPGVHILDVYQGPGGPYGSGPSGLMPGYAFEIVTMDDSGHFNAPRQFDIVVHRGQVLGTEGLPGFEEQMGISDPSLSIGQSLEEFGLKGTFMTEGPLEDADSTLVNHAFKVGYRWDAAKADYVRFGGAHVIEDAGGLR
jgi:hypothetical protein